MSPAKTLDYATASDDLLGSFLAASFTPSYVEERSHLFLRREQDSLSVTLKEQVTGKNANSGKLFRRWKRTFFLHFKLGNDGSLTAYGATPRRMWGRYGNVNRHFYAFVTHSVHPLPEGITRLATFLAPELTLLYARSGLEQKFVDDGSLTKQIARAIYPGRRIVAPTYSSQKRLFSPIFNEKPQPKSEPENREFDFLAFEATYPKALTRYFRNPQFHENLFTKTEKDWSIELTAKFLDSGMSEDEYVRSVWALHLTRRLLTSDERKQILEDGLSLPLELDGPDFRAFLKRFPTKVRLKVLEGFAVTEDDNSQKLALSFQHWLSSEDQASNALGVASLNRSQKTPLALAASASAEEVVESLEAIFNGTSEVAEVDTYDAFMELQSEAPSLGIYWVTGSVSSAAFSSAQRTNPRRSVYVPQERGTFNLGGFAKAWKQERSRLQTKSTHYFRWEKAALGGAVADTPQALIKVLRYAEREAKQALTKHALPVDKAHLKSLLHHADTHQPPKTGTRNPYGLRWFKLRKMGYGFTQIEELDKWRVSLKTAEDMKDSPWEWIEALFSKKAADNTGFEF